MAKKDPRTELAELGHPNADRVSEAILEDVLRIYKNRCSVHLFASAFRRPPACFAEGTKRAFPDMGRKSPKLCRTDFHVLRRIGVAVG